MSSSTGPGYKTFVVIVIHASSRRIQLSVLLPACDRKKILLSESTPILCPYSTVYQKRSGKKYPCSSKDMVSVCASIWRKNSRQAVQR